MKAVALYARVSSDQQAERGTIDSQIAALRERAAADGHMVLPDDVYVDDGFSGTTLLRPALERLRDRIAEGIVELVYVHSPDRLARRYAYQVLLLEEFSAHRVEVRFLQAPSQQSPEDALLLQVQGMLAEYECAKIAERGRRGRLHKARQGVVNVLCCAPYGYRYVRRTDEAPARFEILLPEAKVVRRIFEALVIDQKSLREIADMLTSEHVSTRRGASRWDPSTLRFMLQNPAYVGQAAYGRTEVKGRDPVLRLHRGQPLAPRARNSSHRNKPPAEWISIPVPRIVPDALFAAAREQLERNKRLRHAPGSGGYLLQGLVVCACCRYSFHGVSGGTRNETGKRRTYYRCYGTDAAKFGGKPVCSNASVQAALLDQHVWRSVCNVLRDPDRVLHEWSHRCSVAGTAPHLQRDEAKAAVDRLDLSLKRLLEAYEVGVLSLDELKQRFELLKERQRHARQELGVAESKLAERVALEGITTRLEDFAEHVARGLKELTWEQRQQVIRALIARVEVGEQSITVVFRLPPSGSPNEPDPGQGGDTSEPVGAAGRSPGSYGVCGRLPRPLPGLSGWGRSRARCRRPARCRWSPARGW
jgi:site-specific DNA recombinase